MISMRKTGDAPALTVREDDRALRKLISRELARAQRKPNTTKTPEPKTEDAAMRRRRLARMLIAKREESEA